MGIIQQKETKEMEGEGREAKERDWERKASNKKRKRNSHPLSFSQTLDTTKSKFQSYDTYVLSDPVGWAKGWGALAADVAADDAMRKRVMFDLMNEPDARGIGWATVRICFLHFFPVFVNNQKTAGARLKALVSLSEERESESFFRSSERQRQRVFFFFFALLPEKEANKKLTFSLSLSPLFSSSLQGPGAGNYGATALFLMAMEEIHKVNPTGLFLIEGSGQPTQMSWGDGFASDPWVVGSGQSAAPFFEAVMAKPYAANVVLSPHVYPSSVFDNHNPAVTTGPPLWMRMTNSYGYLTKRGFCASADTEKKACRTFPVIFGETGSFFSAPSDVAMLEDFARYMQTEDAEHNKVPNMLFW